MYLKGKLPETKSLPTVDTGNKSQMQVFTPHFTYLITLAAQQSEKIFI